MKKKERKKELKRQNKYQRIPAEKKLKFLRRENFTPVRTVQT